MCIQLTNPAINCSRQEEAKTEIDGGRVVKRLLLNKPAAQCSSGLNHRQKDQNLEEEYYGIFGILLEFYFEFILNFLEFLL
jgi:hypothetical protein